MTNGTILGKDVLIGFKDGATFLPVGAAKEAEIAFSAATIDTGSKQSGGWASKRTGERAWTMTGSGNAIKTIGVGGDATIASFDKLFQAFKSDTPATVRWKTGEDATANYFEGEAVITELKQTANNGDVVTFSFTFEGDGAPIEAPIV